MGKDVIERLSKQYCPRFGKIAVDKGFVTAQQVKEALTEQIDDNLTHKEHRLLGQILFEKDWITNEQILIVLNELFKDKRRSKETS